MIITRLSISGTNHSNRETNLQFLNGLGRQWMIMKMIIQGDGKIKTLSLSIYIQTILLGSEFVLCYVCLRMFAIVCRVYRVVTYSQM